MPNVTIAVVLGALAVVGSAGAVTQSDAQRPALAVTDTRPFEVRGAGFEPRERVQVLLSANGAQRWQNTVATSAGTFTVEFRLSLGACSRFTMQAFGSKGSRARILTRRAQPDCVSPASAGSHT